MDGRTLTSLPSCFTTKLTQPPAPWLNKEDIKKLQKEGNVLRYLAHKTNLASVWNKCARFATRSRLGSSQLNVLFSGAPYHPINPKNCWILYIVIYILVPSQSRQTLTRWTSTSKGPRGSLFSCSLQKLGCVALFPLLFLICFVLFHRTHLIPPNAPKRRHLKDPMQK